MPHFSLTGFSNTAIEAMRLSLERCVSDLSLPVVLELGEGTPVFAGFSEDTLLARLRNTMLEVWESFEQQDSEAIRYINEKVDEQVYQLYTRNLGNGIYLGVGWKKSISLTQLRAECEDLRKQIERWL